eukprot:6560384-Lingulodinium_polyedra.AAC.1
MFHTRVLGGPPMPTLRFKVRARPRRPATFVPTSRSATSASTTKVAQPGSPHRLRTSANQPWLSRSKAFSWSATVTTGTRPKKRAAGSSEFSNTAHR